MPEYNINGSKIRVIRKEEEKGNTICDNLITALILSMRKEEKNESKQKK